MSGRGHKGRSSFLPRSQSVPVGVHAILTDRKHDDDDDDDADGDLGGEADMLAAGALTGDLITSDEGVLTADTEPGGVGAGARVRRPLMPARSVTFADPPDDNGLGGWSATPVRDTAAGVGSGPGSGEDSDSRSRSRSRSASATPRSLRTPGGGGGGMEMGPLLTPSHENVFRAAAVGFLLGIRTGTRSHGTRYWGDVETLAAGVEGGEGGEPRDVRSLMEADALPGVHKARAALAQNVVSIKSLQKQKAAKLSLLGSMMSNCRIYFSAPCPEAAEPAPGETMLHTPPFALYSVIKSETRSVVQTVGNTFDNDDVDLSWLFLRRKRGRSHKALLLPSFSPANDMPTPEHEVSRASGHHHHHHHHHHRHHKVADEGAGGVLGYDAYFLDNPSLRSGTERVLYQLPGLMISVVPYVSPKELKRQINEQFRTRHEDLHPSLKVTRIRALKRSMVAVAERLSLDLSTVALAFVYFEKLILADKTIDATLKLMSAACVLLAEKFNGPKESDYSRLLGELEREFETSQRYIVRTEFRVMIQLEFALHVPLREVLPHLARLSTQLGRDIVEFGPFTDFQLAFLRRFNSTMPTELAHHQLDEDWESEMDE